MKKKSIQLIQSLMGPGTVTNQDLKLEFTPGQKGLIFDFDGTLADSLGPVLRIIQQLKSPSSSTLNFSSIHDIPLHLAKESRWVELFLKYPLYCAQLVYYLKQAFEIMGQKDNSGLFFPGIIEQLAQLRQKQIPLVILTSNHSTTITSFLRGISPQLFCATVTEVGVFSKTRALKHFLEKSQTTASQWIFVGDDWRDMSAAKSCGLEAIGVTWGLQSAQALINAGAGRILTEVNQIASLDLAPDDQKVSLSWAA